MINSSRGCTMKLRSEPNRSAKTFILLTISIQILTRAHVHGIIRSLLLGTQNHSGKRVGRIHTVLKFLSAAPGLRSFIEGLFYPRHCAWDTEQIRQTRILPLWSSHSSGLTNNPDAANERWGAASGPCQCFVLPIQCLIFSFYNKLTTCSFSETGNFFWVPE